MNLTDFVEIDLIEKREGKLFGYECKWSPRKAVSAPSRWLDTYPNAEFAVITPENYLELLT